MKIAGSAMQPVNSSTGDPDPARESCEGNTRSDRQQQQRAANIAAIAARLCDSGDRDDQGEQARHFDARIDALQQPAAAGAIVRRARRNLMPSDRLPDGPLDETASS